ncbi:permease [Amorphus orientalis]|uniref:Uncharacterized membrane protein YraQ (UPF0718 family) n=1 Tax=Amorphus orientalis TaxID=649198 RepID=A0AAE3VNS0_9HYPH|nr:permease [Amorphus orientalis]MDQ0315322.1 uncharacterized membrane protein YraQ (UPF0718 family) [Amorphus orientalis]
MIDRPLIAPPDLLVRGRWLKRIDGVVLACVAVVAALTMVSPIQAIESIRFTFDNLVEIAPFLLLSVGFAALAAATGADALIGRAFTGSPRAMIAVAALAGALSPFCSCGVIPLIAALLAMGIPLSAVMAFWLASPVMDPSMFLLTSGVLGVDFAVAKTLAAIGLGLFGGLTVHLLARGRHLGDPLRDGVGNGGCGGARVRTPRPVVWRFWSEPERRKRFWRESGKNGLFLLRWLTLAFLLESVMLAWVPADLITDMLGGTGIMPVVTATLLGVPAYLNGYAALPLVGGLVGQGMSPGAGLAFLVAGGVTSVPAALAVWALVRPPVFGLYLALALTGSLASGLLFQLWSTL